MANPKTFTLATLNSGDSLVATTHASVGAAATLASNGIPCKGARMVVLRVVGTGANANTAASLVPVVGNNPGRTSTFFNANGNGYAVAGTVNGDTLASYGTGGGTVAVFPSNAAQAYIHHDFIKAVFTAGTGGHSNVTLYADVYYDFDADQQLSANGQGSYPLTT